MQNVHVRRSYLQYHLVVFLWGFTAILGALITINAVHLVWYRMFLATIFIFLWVLVKRKKLKVSRRNLLLLFAAGTILALHWLSFFMAIKVSNISITVALVSTGAFFTSILEPIFYKRKVIWYEIFFGLIVIFGLYLIFKVETEYLTGIMLALFSAFLYAVFTLINGKITQKGDASVISFYELLFGTALITVYLLYLAMDAGPAGSFTDFFDLSLTNWVYLLLLGLVCTAYPIIAAVGVMKYLSPYTLMLTLNLEPVYGILLALLIFGNQEEMNSGFYYGAAIIVSTVILNVILKSRKKTENRVYPA